MKININYSTQHFEGEKLIKTKKNIIMSTKLKNEKE